MVDPALLANLERLLLADDVGLIVQGVELVVSLDDPELWSALLDGVDQVPDAEDSPSHWRPNARFGRAGASEPFRELAMTLLVAHSPVPLRDRITRLWIRDDGQLDHLPLESLRHYPNLRELEIQAGYELDLSPLGACPSLEVLKVFGEASVALTGLGRCPKLREVEIEGVLASTAGIEGAPIERISVSSPDLRDLRGLDETPVRRAEVHYAKVDPSGLARAPAIRSIVFRWCDHVDVAALAGCLVTELEIHARTPIDLPTLPKLERLTIEGPLRSCAPQPALTALTLRRPMDRGSIDRLAELPLDRLASLRELEIATAVETDLSPLAACPALEVLRVRGTGRVALTGLGRCPKLRELDVTAPIESTAGIEGAPIERISVSSSALADLRGLDETPVRQVEATGKRIDPSGLARAPEIRSVAFRWCEHVDVAALAGCGLTDLRIHAVSPIDLPTLPKLERLAIEGPLRSCAPQPELVALKATAESDAVVLLPPAPSLPKLRSLEVTRLGNGDLEFLRGAGALESARFRSCSLRDVSALADLARLGWLELVDCDVALTHLPARLDRLGVGPQADLQRLPATEVELLEPYDARDLGVFARLRRVGKLAIGWSPDLAQLARVPVETLWFCPSEPISLAPLIGHPTLRSITWTGDRADRVEVPPELRAIARPG